MRRPLAALAALALVTVAASCGSHGHKTAGRATTTTGAGAAVTTTTPGATGAGDVYAHTRAGELAAAVKDIPTRVYVPNSESDTVDVIDPTTYRVVDHFKVDRQPQHVTPSWDLTTLYVDNDLGNTLTPIDARTGRPGKAIPVEDPYNLYFTPDGSKAIVVAERLHRLDIRDPHTWKLLRSIPISHNGVDHADFTADGSTAIFSCEYDGWLVRVDLNALKVTGSLHVGGQPIDVKLSPDGSHFYVANQQRAGVSIVDAASFTETGFVPTGAGAHGMYPSRDGRLLYVSNRVAGTVSVLDFADGTLKATWDIGGSPDMGGVTDDGRQLWLSGRYNGVVYVIDTATGKLAHTITVGNAPHGLDIFPQPGRYSLGHTGVYR